MGKRGGGSKKGGGGQPAPVLPARLPAVAAAMLPVEAWLSSLRVRVGLDLEPGQGGRRGVGAGLRQLLAAAGRAAGVALPGDDDLVPAVVLEGALQGWDLGRSASATCLVGGQEGLGIILLSV